MQQTRTTLRKSSGAEIADDMPVTALNDGHYGDLCRKAPGNYAIGSHTRLPGHVSRTVTHRTERRSLSIRMCPGIRIG